MWPQNNTFNTVKIAISKGSSLAEITNQLLDQKIISNRRTFLMAVKAMGHETDIPAGTYRLQEARTNFQIITQLVNGTPVLRRVTVLEGWTMETIAENLVQRVGIDKARFLQLCHDTQFIHQLGIPSTSLEGFLFPETYYFPEGEKEEVIIHTMVEEYRKVMNDKNRARAAELGFSELELVTLASIIEGEAIYDSERPIISGVYHNRLKLGMRLQADPTIQYIIDDSPRRLLNRDLKIKSPYNTYLNYGLPPGPINSPGKESLLAALYPDDNEYLYFVARGDGYHTFSITPAEHNKAKRKFQKIRRAARRQKRAEQKD